ncbi:hypothetical protein EJB05_23149, partial [Eragrostis curvula]
MEIKTRGRRGGKGAAVVTDPEHHHKPSTRPAPAWLPTELVLEIVDRCDPATLIICAATCRLLRRRILDPAFIERLRAAGRFAPSSRLLGLFYRHYEGEPAVQRPTPFTPTTPGVVRTPFAHDVFEDDGYTPVECRGGLLVLRRSALFAERADLCVCDPVTGRRAFLPPPEVHQQSYALLLAPRRDNDVDGSATAGGGVSSMFRRLIVVDLSRLRFWYTVRAQSFSPDDGGGGAWGAVVEAFTPDDLWPRVDVARQSPVILGGVLHWLCTDQRTVLTFDSDTSEVGAVQIPHGHHLCRNMPLAQKQLLASTPNGELSLLVVERLVISVWVLQTTATGDEWTRRATVDLEKIMNVPAETVLRSQRLLSGIVRLEWAGEMSGAVVVAQVAGVGLMVLDLEAEKVVCTVRRSCRNSDTSLLPFRYCPYERDLIQRLAAMAPLHCNTRSRFGERAEQVGCSTRSGRLGPVCGGGRRSTGEALTGGAEGERSGGHEKGSGMRVVEGAELLELAVETTVLLR